MALDFIPYMVKLRVSWIGKAIQFQSNNMINILYKNAMILEEKFENENVGGRNHSLLFKSLSLITFKYNK
jgi:hypothetical protein